MTLEHEFPDLVIRRDTPVVVNRLFQINGIIGLAPLKGKAQLLNAIVTVAGVAREIGIEKHEAFLQKDFQENMDFLANELRTTVTETPNQGALIKVTLFVDPTGTFVRVPGDQFLTVIGEGHGPVDAMARFINRGGEIRTDVPLGFDEISYYMWFDDTDQFTHIMPDDRQAFYARSEQQARTLDRLGVWENNINEAGLDLDYIDVASAWRAEVSNFAAQTNDAMKLARVNRLMQAAEKAQKEFVAAYADYQRASMEVAKSNRLAKILDAAATVSSLLTSSADLASLAAQSGNQSVERKTPSDRAPKATSERDYFQFRIDEYSTIRGNQRIEMRRTEGIFRGNIEELGSQLDLPPGSMPNAIKIIE